jgi:hypothetical protein
MPRRWSLQQRVNRAPGLARLTGQPDGLDCPFPHLRLDIRTRDGRYLPLSFQFDTGADFMVILTSFADRYEIPYTTDYAGVVGTLGGAAACYYGFVTVRCHLTRREYRWPCGFTTGEGGRLLLGRAGFLDEFAVAIVEGEFVVRRLGRLARSLARLRLRLRSWLGRAGGRAEWEPL